MKKESILLLTSLLLLVVFGSFVSLDTPIELGVTQRVRNDFERYIDAGYFLQSASLQSLSETYHHPDKKIKILLVPGHTDESPGAIYKDHKEIDFTFAATDQLYRDLSNEDWVEVEVASLRNGDVGNFKTFFSEHGNEVELFETQQKNISEELRNRLLLEEAEEGNHVVAKREVAELLYGVNHYANQHDFDLVLHVHFNDYPRMGSGTPGKYEGYAMYVPDEMYSNSVVSGIIAEHISSELSITYGTSTHPLEKEGVIQSRELIAVGAHNSARTPSILIEYAYIYEDFMQAEKSRSEAFKIMSRATIVGVQKSFK